jgi:hypothetical protein
VPVRRRCASTPKNISSGDLSNPYQPVRRGV